MLIEISMRIHPSARHHKCAMKFCQTTAKSGMRLKVWFGVSVGAALAAMIAAKAAPTVKTIALYTMKTLLLIAPERAG
jgi:ethanolamine utilization microcompartment shell protein EutL